MLHDIKPADVLVEYRTRGEPESGALATLGDDAMPRGAAAKAPLGRSSSSCVVGGTLDGMAPERAAALAHVHDGSDAALAARAAGARVAAACDVLDVGATLHGLAFLRPPRDAAMRGVSSATELLRIAPTRAVRDGAPAVVRCMLAFDATAARPAAHALRARPVQQRLWRGKAAAKVRAPAVLQRESELRRAHEAEQQRARCVFNEMCCRARRQRCSCSARNASAQRRQRAREAEPRRTRELGGGVGAERTRAARRAAAAACAQRRAQARRARAAAAARARERARARATTRCASGWRAKPP